MEYPVQRHKNCENKYCNTCYEDSTLLTEYLEKKTDNYSLDLLGRYHMWLTNRGIKAETEFGWFSEEAFKPENIDAYINDWKGV